VKLRIFDDSIRFRLTRSEVARIEHGETVESVCRFPGGETLVYALTVGDVKRLDARMRDGRIEIAIPRDRALTWASSNEISLRGEARANGVFRMLIEKDFTCIEPRADEDQDPADLYPNPKAARRGRRKSTQS
jgi:uncharacterized protein DUF7009